MSKDPNTQIESSVDGVHWEEHLGVSPPLTNDIGAIVIKIGASKNDKQKPDLSLIPMVAQVEEAIALMVGEKKYGRYNYCKGHKASQLVAAAQRHLLAWFNGEECDPIDGQSHLGSVKATISMLLRQKELGTLKDDRFDAETLNIK